MVSDAKAKTLESIDEYAVVSYVDTEDHLSAVALCDFTFANAIGASLARVPAPVAAENSKARVCPDNLRSNFEEVMNISTSLLTSPDSHRLVLESVSVPPHDSNLDAGAVLAEGTGTVAFKIDLEKYGVGYIAYRILE